MANESVPSLTSDENLSALDKLELYFERTALTQRQTAKQLKEHDIDLSRQLYLAREVGGDVLAQAYELYWSYILELIHQDSMAHSFDNWEKRFKDRYKPTSPFGTVSIAHENQCIWEMFIDPRINEITIFADDLLIYPDDSLEQLLVSFLLSCWQLRQGFQNYFNSWMPQSILDDDPQWELLWNRPFIRRQCIFYAHKNQNILLGCGGWHERGMLTIEQSLLPNPVVNQRLSESPEFKIDNPPKSLFIGDPVAFPGVVWDFDEDIPF